MGTPNPGSPGAIRAPFESDDECPNPEFFESDGGCPNPRIPGVTGGRPGVTGPWVSQSEGPKSGFSRGHPGSVRVRRWCPNPEFFESDGGCPNPRRIRGVTGGRPGVTGPWVSQSEGSHRGPPGSHRTVGVPIRGSRTVGVPIRGSSLRAHLAKGVDVPWVVEAVEQPKVPKQRFRQAA